MTEEHTPYSADTDFTKTIRRAKRKVLLRTVSISFIVSAVLLACLYALGTWLMHDRVERESTLDFAWSAVQGANIEAVGTGYSYTPFSASADTQLIKPVGSVQIPWGELEKTFTVFGTSHEAPRNFGISSGSTGMERAPLYFNGERVIELYHPELSYASLPDDRTLLPEISEDKYVEMALSFDAVYTMEEVQSLLGESVDWYWADTLRETDRTGAFPIPGRFAFGFRDTETSEESAEIFLQQLKWLSENDSERREEAAARYERFADSEGIAGVVVTGTPSELAELTDIPEIRAAVLGATADQY
ncbi:anti sigma factor C-terminal domain-containing protein [Indiicoccus explosivorum]|uniref:anti sigma factor C-terminal domain-containing protein n=1 Tax=Indiicoccus explosivorum TaxID=1917864 RepID=UPI000B433E54|nr:anti sigma factor C-terminal domain-containing protein [Indiicoccus explosivorum]